MHYLKLININASRYSSVVKVEGIFRFIQEYDPFIVCIQEINIITALRVFSNKFQVFINIEDGTKDGVGMVSLVKQGVKVQDEIIGRNGRIIGLRIENYQFWNVYPKSGSGFKKERETFFREELTELFVQWKDSTKYIFQLGDHNCTHREEDSLYNGAQHLQKGLVSHIQLHGLMDDFLKVHGNEMVMFSRQTETSKTRIDYIFSNTNACSYFQYISVDGLDHSAVLASYDINFNVIIEGTKLHFWVNNHGSR